jgi:hypothetical protein
MLAYMFPLLDRCWRMQRRIMMLGGRVCAIGDSGESRLDFYLCQVSV